MAFSELDVKANAYLAVGQYSSERIHDMVPIWLSARVARTNAEKREYRAAKRDRSRSLTHKLSEQQREYVVASSKTAKELARELNVTREAIYYLRGKAKKS